jgi:predicted HTH transcriptional regulator
MSEVTSQELINFILHGREERNLEYKGPMSWKERDVKIEITRSILGMANLRDGGSIIIGVENEAFTPVGMQLDQAQSFTQDKVDDFVRNYADPFVETKVTQVPYNGKDFIVIQIREFELLPVICKKDGKLRNGKLRLRRGVIYTRSRGKSETIEVPSQTEMREIIDLAVDKGIRRFIERMGRTGVLEIVMEPSDVEKFDQQLEEMK